MLPRGDGDGWTRCALGHKHWGIFGAAGLLLRHGDLVLLQHRALWSHHGGWSYTTVIAHAAEPVLPTGLTRETLEVRWVPADDLDGLPLHPGFAATWSTVRAIA